MLSFFADLITHTDEDRRAFENHPVLLAAVADGMSVERYRALLLELYHVVWNFNPVCAAAASRMGTPSDERLQPIRHFLYEHAARGELSSALRSARSRAGGGRV